MTLLWSCSGVCTRQSHRYRTQVYTVTTYSSTGYVYTYGCGWWGRRCTGTRYKWVQAFTIGYCYVWPWGSEQLHIFPIKLWIDGLANGWRRLLDELLDGCMGGWVDGWVGGQDIEMIDGCTYTCIRVRTLWHSNGASETRGLVFIQLMGLKALLLHTCIIALFILQIWKSYYLCHSISTGVLHTTVLLSRF